jgi:hypothetical protein
MFGSALDPTVSFGVPSLSLALGAFRGFICLIHSGLYWSEGDHYLKLGITHWLPWRILRLSLAHVSLHKVASTELTSWKKELTKYCLGPRKQLREENKKKKTSHAPLVVLLYGPSPRGINVSANKSTITNERLTIIATNASEDSGRLFLEIYLRLLTKRLLDIPVQARPGLELASHVFKGEERV